MELVKCLLSGGCCKRARAFAYYSSPQTRGAHACLFAALHSGKELYHTFSGLSGRLGSSGLSAYAYESTTERPEVSNYLPIQRFVFSLTTDIGRMYTCVCLQRCMGHYSAYLQRNRFRLCYRKM